MNKFLKKLNNQNVIIGDGAMGTQLHDLGLTAGETPEKWNIEYPDKILKIHKKYIEAGAELLETNTFGGNYIRLKESNLDRKLKEINENAVQLAKKAANKETIIAGSVGPTGKMLEPLGDLTKKEAYDAYNKQISLLVENKVDVIIIETFTDLNEIKQALKAAENIKIPVIAQMNFRKNLTTVMGTKIQDLVELTDKFEIHVLGVNCTPGVKNTLPVVKKINELTSKPISVFPNAGKPAVDNGNLKYPEKAEDYIPYIEKLIKYNVKLMGGCCGTTPEIISKIKNKVNKIS